MRLIDRINLFREKQFNKMVELDRKKYEETALNWWWNLLSETYRSRLNNEYGNSVNLFADSGCNGSIVWIYGQEKNKFFNKKYVPISNILFTFVPLNN